MPRFISRGIFDFCSVSAMSDQLQTNKLLSRDVTVLVVAFRERMGAVTGSEVNRNRWPTAYRALFFPGCNKHFPEMLSCFL